MKQIDNKLTQKFDEYPQFGVLQGVKVFVTGTNIAGPFAGCLMAEMGAQVLQAESPSIACQTRGTLSWSQNTATNIPLRSIQQRLPDVKSSIKCVEWADIWIEAGKRDLTQNAVLQINPAGNTIKPLQLSMYQDTDSLGHLRTNRPTMCPDRQWADICT